MARRRISILESFLSGGRVGSSRRRSRKATLKASTRMRSRAAWAERYFSVARRRFRLSSRVSRCQLSSSLATCAFFRGGENSEQTEEGGEEEGEGEEEKSLGGEGAALAARRNSVWGETLQRNMGQSMSGRRGK